MASTCLIIGLVGGSKATFDRHSPSTGSGASITHGNEEAKEKDKIKVRATTRSRPRAMNI